MRQRHVQAIYQALPDKNVPLGSYAIGQDYVQQQGRRLIESFRGHSAYWALLVAPSSTQVPSQRRTLAAVFSAPAGGMPPLRLQCEALHESSLQDSSEGFLRTLLAAVDLAPCEQKALWLLVSATEVQGAVPPLLSEIPGMLPGHVDVSGLPRDQFLAKLAAKFLNPPQRSIAEMGEELQNRLDIVMSLTSGDSGSLQSLISDEFKRGVAFALGSQYGYTLGERINSTPVDPGGQTARKNDKVEWLVQATGFCLLLGEGLRTLAEELVGIDVFAQVQDFARSQFGFDIPEHKVHVQVAPNLPERRARLLFRDAVLAETDVPANRSLVLGARHCLLQLESTIEPHPVDNSPAVWAEASVTEQARGLRCTVLSPQEAALQWMRRAVFVNPCAFFSTQSAQQLLDDTALSHPALIEECLRLRITPRWVRRIAHLLLRQRIALHDRVSLLETLLDEIEARSGPQLDDTELRAVACAVRRKLRFALQSPWMTPEGHLPVLRLRAKSDVAACKQQLEAALREWPHLAPPVLLVREELLEQAVSFASEVFPLLPVLGEHEVAPTTTLFPSYEVAL